MNKQLNWTLAKISLRLIATACVAIMFTACEKTAEDVVKAGEFIDHPGVSVGKAFERAFTDTKWETTETAAGQAIVVFTGRTPSDANKELDGIEATMAEKGLSAAFASSVTQTRFGLLTATYNGHADKKPSIQAAKTMKELMDIATPPNSQVTARFLVENLEQGNFNLESCESRDWWATGCNQTILLGFVYGNN